MRFEDLSGDDALLVVEAVFNTMCILYLLYVKNVLVYRVFLYAHPKISVVYQSTPIPSMHVHHDVRLHGPACILSTRSLYCHIFSIDSHELYFGVYLVILLSLLPSSLYYWSFVRCNHPVVLYNIHVRLNSKCHLL